MNSDLKGGSGFVNTKSVSRGKGFSPGSKKFLGFSPCPF
jgi:hypothetical protein